MQNLPVFMGPQIKFTFGTNTKITVKPLIDFDFDFEKKRVGHTRDLLACFGNRKVGESRASGQRRRELDVVEVQSPNYSSMADDEHQDVTQSSSLDFYQPKPTVRNAAVTALQSGAVGVLVSAVQNALGSHNRGAMGILTRSGGTIGFFGMLYLPSGLRDLAERHVSF